ncbi:rod shape-determining protein MreD [Pacificimonas sp. WHA3]|uniref:Rod shape-determining protein MreD n=1 Tax=Pacificimonas pallii TaxID=2827236 RepID=A0ABS6SGG9_9SPHN|nr:rod shape-determining protein MreD [Pacificimonas pallii]MBV7256937.1 rod shape-determining protein MreD [Pacificimonas pallii]
MKRALRDYGRTSARPSGSLSFLERSGNWLRSLRVVIAPIVVAAGLILSAAPVFTPLASWPNFALVLVYLYALYRPNQLAAWTGVPLGVLADIVFAMPVGANALLMPLFMIAVQWVDRQGSRVHWLADWALAVPLLLAYQLILWRLCLIAAPSDLPGAEALPFLYQGLASLAAFPLVAVLFVRIQRRFVDGIRT